MLGVVAAVAFLAYDMLLHLGDEVRSCIHALIVWAKRVLVPGPTDLEVSMHYFASNGTRLTILHPQEQQHMG